MKILSLERLEAQLKACHCSFVFSKIKVSQNNYSLHIENNDLFQCFSVLFIKNQTAFVLYTSRLLLYFRYNVGHLRRFTFKCCHSFYFSFFSFFLTRDCVCVSVQPSLLALALLCFEAHDEHDPEHLDKISEALSNLQQQLNVSPALSLLL